MTIRANTIQVEAPSILAASSRSRGIVMTYWRIRKMKKALPKKFGTISGR